MKVLFVTPEYPPDFGGGIATYYGALIPALRNLGFEVSILKGSAFVHGGAPYSCDGVTVTLLETARYEEWQARFAHFAMFPELRRHLAASFALYEQGSAGHGFDVVEVTDWGMLFVPWSIAATRRVIVQLHGSVGQIFQNEPVAGREVEGIFSLLLEKATLGGASAVASYSQNNARWWGQVLERAVDYVPPPLQIDREATALPAPGHKWLAVGRIQTWKGPQIACAAWELLDEAPVLEWMGRDTVHGATGLSTSAWLRREFPETWGQTVQPIGQASSFEVRERMLTARAVIVPSSWDVFNLVTAEAMALGKVVVVSNGAGSADLIQHGVNGFTFPGGDAAALAGLVRQIERLDASALLAIGCAAADTVRRQLNPIAVAKAKAALYRSLPLSPGTPPQLAEGLLRRVETTDLKFLDSLPLKDLSRYVLRRTARKAQGKAGAN